MAKRLLISFSGGRTSAYMTWCLLKKYEAIYFPEHKMFLGIERIGAMIIIVEILVVFANTSREEEETLIFINNCDKFFGFNTIWIEGVFNKESNVGTEHKIIDFKIAKRQGECYDEMMAVYGMPNQDFPHCTRELKTVPITKLVRSYGWSEGTYDTCIGYRIDEPKRWAAKKKRISAIKKRHIYYFVHEKPTTKLQVNGWWKLQSFNLNLEEYEGNCKKCWKKSDQKLICKEGADIHNKKIDDWVDKMEDKYEYFTPETRTGNPPYLFYRGNKSIKDIREMAQKYFKDAFGDTDKMEIYIRALLGSYDPAQVELFNCEESCEPF